MTTFDLPATAPGRTPTRPIDVELLLTGGRELPATLYLATLSETHAGRETLSEALNRPRPFLPARLRASGETVLLRASGIRTVAVSADALEDDASPGTPGCLDIVRLELDDGSFVEGTLATVLPPETPRLSDYFNLAEGTFVPLTVDDGVTFVNRNVISIVWL